MGAGDLDLWYMGMMSEAVSMFVYYLTGALTLSFVVCLLVTRSLRRKEAKVFDLSEQYECSGLTVSYLVVFTTALTEGLGIPENVKVFLQLQGENSATPFVMLKSNKGGRPILQRGHTDIFLIKVEETLGRISEARLVLSGLSGPLSWRLTAVELYLPWLGRKRNLPVTVTATETFNLYHKADIVKTVGCCEKIMHSLYVHHQWLSAYNNPVRYGAFTEVVHISLMFMTIITLLTITQILYIVLPRNGTADTFYIDLFSLGFGSVSASIVCFILCLVLELTIRHVRSREKRKIGAAYRNVVNPLGHVIEELKPKAEKYLVENTANRSDNQTQGFDNSCMFVMEADPFAEESAPLKLQSRSRFSLRKRFEYIMPHYLQRLITAGSRLKKGSVQHTTAHHHTVQEQVNIASGSVRFDSTEPKDGRLEIELPSSIIDLVHSDNRSQNANDEAATSDNVMTGSVGIKDHGNVDLINTKQGCDTYRTGNAQVYLTTYTQAHVPQENASAGLEHVHDNGITNSLTVNTLGHGLRKRFARQAEQSKSVHIQQSVFSGKSDGFCIGQGDDTMLQVEEPDKSVSTTDIKIDIGKADYVCVKIEDDIDMSSDSVDNVLNITDTISESNVGATTCRDDLHGQSIASSKHQCTNVLFVNSQTDKNVNANTDNYDNDGNANANTFNEDTAGRKSTVAHSHSHTCSNHCSSEQLKHKSSKSNMVQLFEEQQREIVDLRKVDSPEPPQDSARRPSYMSYLKKAQTMRNSIIDMRWDSDQSIKGTQPFNVDSHGSLYDNAVSRAALYCDADSKETLHEVDLGKTASNWSQVLSGYTDDANGARSGEYKLNYKDSSSSLGEMMNVELMDNEEDSNSSAQLSIVFGDHNFSSSQSTTTDSGTKLSYSAHEPEVDLPEMPDQSIVKKPRFVKEHCLSNVWQQSLRLWARSFVQDMFRTLKKFKNYSDTDFPKFGDVSDQVVVWIHSVMDQIPAAVIVKGHCDVQEMLLTLELVPFLFHVAAEVVLLSVRASARTQARQLNNNLGEIVIQSHCLMLAVNQAADCVVYCVENRQADDVAAVLAKTFGKLDCDQDVMHVATEIYSQCVHITLDHQRCLWTFCKNLQKQRENSEHNIVKNAILSKIMNDAETKDSIKLSLATKQICQFIVEDAKNELAPTYEDELTVFTDVLIKQTVLHSLRLVVDSVARKKKHFVKENDLEERHPLTRKQKIMERLKRKKTYVEVKDGDTVRMVTWDEKEKIQKVLEKEVKKIDDVINMIQTIHDSLKRRWERQGLKARMAADKYLAQTVLHPHVKLMEGGHGYRFINILHLKRTEAFLSKFLRETVEHMTRYLVKSAMAGITVTNYQNVHPEMVMEDIVVKVDGLSCILLPDMDNIMHEVVQTEAVQDRLHTDAKASTVSFNINMSAHVAEVDESKSKDAANKESSTSNKLSKKAVSKKGRSKDSDQVVSEDKDVDKQPPVEEETDLIQSMINDLKPLKFYLCLVNTSEGVRNKTTISRYMTRCKRKREYFCNINLQNFIDSYYMIEEGKDSNIHTKQSLYQLEYDVLGESDRPLPGGIKSFLMVIIQLVILFGIFYITMVGSQFTTTQAQEWVCFFLLAVAEFGIVFEPWRAVIVGFMMAQR